MLVPTDNIIESGRLLVDNAINVYKIFISFGVINVCKRVILAGILSLMSNS